MIRTKATPSLVEQSKSKVQAWLAQEATSAQLRAQIAGKADLHERTLRLAASKKWDPRASTLSRLEALIEGP